MDTNAKGMIEGMLDKERHDLAAQVDNQRMQLISPPPEEILSLQWGSGSRIRTTSTPATSASTIATQAGVVSKRKRAPPTPVKPSTSTVEDKAPETTPNPKPKKKVVLQSPHAKNLDADYIPALVLSGDQGKELERAQNPSMRRVLLSARRSRRSATPIPPYEPPADIFTPPREVFMSPAPAKSAPKRKGSVGRQTRARTKGRELRVNTNVRVKQEIPDDIDLLAPMPPPSPTDDPLLLRGPPKLKPVSKSWHRETNLIPAQGGRQEDEEPVRFFDTGGSDGGWSDSDGDVASKANNREGEDEFTGKWGMMKVRTEQDLPSATRMRQEIWDRPISPYPRILVGEGEEEEEVRRLSTEPDDEFGGGEQQNSELPVPIEGVTDFQGEDVPALEDSQDDDSTDTVDELDVVKITSADPMAAARAVAILKRHDYDCYTKLAKKRRTSQSATVDFAKEHRRKDVSSAGILKISDQRRRRSTMGVIGDKVIIPGSPITTLPDLLQQAEAEIAHLAPSSARSATTPIREQAGQDPFRTPTSVKFDSKGESITIPKRYPVGPRAWTREDWKLLDACFTDQRINPGDSHDMLAAVDAVALEDVVARFVDLLGGQPLVDTFGETWSRDSLFERTKTLLKKQRSGNVAPPTTPISSYTSPLNFAVPDFTPIHERRQGLPPTLLAPRYSHLLEESAAINDILPSSTHSEDNVMSSGGKQISDVPFHSPFTRDLSPQRLESVPLANNLGDRFKGFFSSYLPILSKSSKKARAQEQPCLPLPSPSVLQKPRGPVETPLRPLVPRAPHPKDLVHLNHILLKPSKIPRTKPIPKRLVELVPVPHTTTRPGTTSRDGMVPRPRRSSGSSVKDLVRGFEQMDKKFGGFGSTRTLKQGQEDLKPIWKP